MTNVYNSKLNFISAMMAITTIGLVDFILFIVKVKKEQAVFIKVIKIYKQPILEEE
jgi:hypothetical protein